MREFIDIVAEPLLEARVEVVDVRGVEVWVRRDPTRNEVNQFVTQAPLHIMRGMVMNDGHFYLWDSIDGGHADVCRALGGRDYNPFIVCDDFNRLRNESDWERESFYQSGSLYLMMDDALAFNEVFTRRFPGLEPVPVNSSVDA